MDDQENERPCSTCLAMLPRNNYTGKQWQKKDSSRRCNLCMNGKCSVCLEVKGANQFSLKQWKMGSNRKCKSCIKLGSEGSNNCKVEPQCTENLASNLGFVFIDQ